MKPISPTSQTELVTRRQQLRRQRRWRFLQNSWRFLTVSGLAAGSVWLITRPAWMIHQPDQITIQGNQLLSTQSIQTLLPLDYPQALLAIEPQALEIQLEAQAPIAQATVSRHLMPPRLIVQVHERRPVAVALPAQQRASQATSSASAAPSSSTPDFDTTQTGLLDAEGTWMPLRHFTDLDQSWELPTLQVRGMKPQHQADWPTLYQAVQDSPVRVTEIDWRQPSNLILQTELGSVHLGPFSGKFSAQLAALDQMRQLPDQLNGQQFAYIDLRNPKAPTLQMMTKD